MLAKLPCIVSKSSDSWLNHTLGISRLLFSCQHSYYPLTHALLKIYFESSHQATPYWRTRVAESSTTILAPLLWILGLLSFEDIAQKSFNMPCKQPAWNVNSKISIYFCCEFSDSPLSLLLEAQWVKSCRDTNHHRLSLQLASSC